MSDRNGYRLRPYQEKLVSDVVADLRSSPKGNKLHEVVLAAAPNSGKTLMSIDVIARLLNAGAVKRVLVLSHAMTLLRSQFADTLERANPRFKWREYFPVGHPMRVPIQKIREPVIVTLPQTIQASDAGAFDLVIVDEAHTYYGKPMVTGVVKRSGARRVLLLTGTPAPFIAKGHGSDPEKPLHLIALHEVLQAGRGPGGKNSHCADPRIQLLNSDFNHKITDYNQDREVKASVRSRKGDAHRTLDRLLGWFEKQAKATGWAAVLGALKKTMFVCRSQDDASQVYSYLCALGVRTELSTSETDGDSEGVERFKDDRAVLVLVVVRRGSLGFDYADLTAMVDLTGSMNIDRIFQMICRVVRKGNGNGHQKMFVKTASRQTVGYAVDVLRAACSLGDRGKYETWNGKNLGGFKIPARPSTSGSHFGGAGKGRNQGAKDGEDPEVDPGFLLFDDFIETDMAGAEISGAWTTLGKSYEACFGARVSDPSGRKAKIVEYWKNNGSPVPPGHMLYTAQGRYSSPSSESFDAEFSGRLRRIRIDARCPVGEKFGRLLVVGAVTSESPFGLWRVRCDCGVETEKIPWRVKSGQNKHCGVSCMLRGSGKRKLTDLQIAAIRRSSRRSKELADRLGVSERSIYRVRSQGMVRPALGRSAARP